ncbi:MAG: hypothetical protein K6G85_01150 [Eubacterium sp.]|nr:hypothetical protein [Eubacterium sp.]
MKKTAYLIMAGMMAVSMVGCGSSASNKEETTATAKEATSAIVETTIEETTIEETTKKEETTTKEKETEASHPAQESKCKTPEDAIQPVCDGFMNADVDEMFSTFPGEFQENKNFKSTKKQLKDVLKQLAEMKEQGLVYEVSVKDVGEPQSTDIDTLNSQYQAAGMNFKITDIKKVGLSVTVSMDGQSATQDIMTCIAGKIGDYWYFVSAEQ